MSNAIVWFRQDLRLCDNPAWTLACNNHDFVLPLYIHDTSTLNIGGAQQWWLHHSLISLDNGLNQIGLNLCLRRGKPLDILEQYVRDHKIEAIYWNRCYEPLAIERDTNIKQFFKTLGILVYSANGSLLHEPWDITNKSGQFFKVFTPFWNTCLKQINIPNEYKPINAPNMVAANSDTLTSWTLLPTAPNWAQEFGNYWQPGENGALAKLADFIDINLSGYNNSRDNPAKDATSKLSPHLHFGEISPWQIWRAINIVKLDPKCDIKSIERFLAEIGWREFSYYLLYHRPSLPKANFKSNFDTFPWKNDNNLLKSWQTGQTGYPIIDAGMRELWNTGYMHNRVRMIVASFLTKDLLIDWRLGAEWFLDTLVDADLASNSASWQWVAGCGADAAPYFRIFNPILQGEKFDPEGAYIKKWVPELQSVSSKWIHKPWMDPSFELKLSDKYPKPIVDHAKARKMALFYYKEL